MTTAKIAAGTRYARRYKQVRIDKPKTLSIKQLIKFYTKIAKELHYKSCYIEKLKKSKTEDELLTIMSQARNDY